jgi:hypothetical protein
MCWKDLDKNLQGVDASSTSYHAEQQIRDCFHRYFTSLWFHPLSTRACVGVCMCVGGEEWYSQRKSVPIYTCFRCMPRPFKVFHVCLGLCSKVSFPTSLPASIFSSNPLSLRSELTKLWHTGRFPWHAAFTAVPVFLFLLPD